jgi:uncharacterized protein (TIGR00251 family)
MSAWEKVLSQNADGVILRLYVQPGSRRASVIGLHDDRLKVAVTAPPDRGRANAAVVRLIADVFQLARTDVQILRGDVSRQKDLFLARRCVDDVRRVLDDLIERHQ